MSRPLRLGAVGYLNTKPLVYGLERQPERFDVRFDVPSKCAALLHAADVDLGLIPSIEYQRGDYRIVPGIAIASRGPVASVAMFTRTPLAKIRRIALDTSSRTSAGLLRVLCDERFGVQAEFVSHGPDLAGMLEVADAGLLIGDPALFTEHDALRLDKYDLGAEWTAMTGLPFVWAFWAGRPGVAAPDDCCALTSARDAGMRSVSQIARAYGAGDAHREAVAARYLTEFIKFDLGPDHVAALARYYASASRLGIVDSQRPPLFYEVP
jgi:chorismate dehydratase